MNNFWPHGWLQLLTWIGPLVLAASLSWWGWIRVGQPIWPKNRALDYVVWERDRVQALAKGSASSAIGFLTTLVVALLKQEIKSDVPGVTVLGCLLGAVAMMIFAARMSMSVQVTRAAEENAR